MRWIVEIAIGVALVVRDLPAHALGEDLRAAAGQRVEPGRHQLAQHLLVGHAVEIGEERDLDRREALQVDVRADALEAAQQLRVVARTADPGCRPLTTWTSVSGWWRALPQLVPRLLERHRVGAGVAGLQPRERAEQTARHADVGRLEPDVVVVERAARRGASRARGWRASRRRADRAHSNSRTPSSRSRRSPRVELVGDVEEAGGGEAGVHLVIGHLVIG